MNSRRKGHIIATYADSFFLPFALLADNTFLPPAVAILALKPCTLACDLFFGWNVIFITLHLLLTHRTNISDSLFCPSRQENWRTNSLVSILEYHVYYMRNTGFRQVNLLFYGLCKHFSG
jgi:hypothetical protein